MGGSWDLTKMGGRNGTWEWKKTEIESGKLSDMLFILTSNDFSHSQNPVDKCYEG